MGKSINSIKRRKIIIRLLIISLILFVSSWFFIDRWAKKHGFSGAGDFVKTVVVNYWSSFDAVYDTIEITISQDDFSKLEIQRENHLKRGIITKSEDRYVRAIISYNGKKIKCKLRLKGHMTDHLQDKKWSFRIKTVKGDAFQGMKIFSLMHPGTRNYIYEWIYHQMLTEEGIATVRYSFLNLKVNGESWGIYALEENFAAELLGNHKLPKGPILGFNPDLYWYSRINELEKINIDKENLKINASYPEAYDEDDLYNSEKERKDYAEAISKLEKFKLGELKTSEVFDIDKLARFHAILDLVGGQFSLDWSDVKYYYNPLTQKIEPVGYESFSVRNTTLLCGAYKFKNEIFSQTELHERIFSDSKFFELYIKHLKRISKSEYLDAFFNKKDVELKNNLSILYTEFPYKKLPIEQYYTNQKNIIAILNTPILPALYLESFKNDSLNITVGSNSFLPIRIKNVVYDNNRFKIDTVIYISSRKRNEQVYYESIKIPFNKPGEFDPKKFSLSLLFPGMNKVVDCKIKPIEISEALNENKDFLNEKPNYLKFDFVKVNELKKEIILDSGTHIIDQNLIFPSGYSVIANAPLQLIINNNSRIISSSELIFNGTEDSPIEVSTTDSSGNGIIIINAPAESKFYHVDFLNLNKKVKKSSSHEAMLIFYQSNVKFNYCNFSSDANDGIQIVRSKVNVRNSIFGGFKNNAFVSDYSQVKFESVKFIHCEKDGIDLNGSSGSMKDLVFDFCFNSISLKNGTMITADNITISNGEMAFYVSDLSKINLNRIKLENLKLGFKAEKKSDVFGPSEINVKNLKKENVKLLSETDKNSKINIK